MPVAQKIKEKAQPKNLVPLLNQSLANAIHLSMCAKQAHWNVKGENFIALHELFDKVAGEAYGYADMVAERAVQLGGIAQGTLHGVVSQTDLSGYPVDIENAQDHVAALADVIGVVAEAYGQAILTATQAGDMVTADLYTEATRGLDKLHWLVRSHATQR